MNKKVLVVGDTILDEYVFGNIDRVNPEAPWSTVLDLDTRKRCLGGAANVAANIRTLSETNPEIVYLGYVSPFINEMFSTFKINSLATDFLYNDDILLKTRFVHDNHILLRVDKNKDYKTFNKSSKEMDLLHRAANNKHDQFDLIVFSDYNKKTLSNELIKSLLKKYHEAAVMFDIKKSFSPAIMNELPEKTIIKCNYKEWQHLNDIGFWTSVTWKKGWNILRTNGKFGYTLIDSIEEYSFNSVNVGEIVDVVGCGDVFLAGMVVSYLENNQYIPLKYAEFANKCAAAKVKKFGTTTVERKEINV